jgi:hypothetical protein
MEHESIRQTFAAALDAMVDQVKEDRSILAARCRNWRSST